MKTITKKIVLLGNESVGKTSLVKRYVHSIFNDEYLTTIGIKISKKTVELKDVKVNLMLWDIAGDMMNKSLYNNYLQGAHGLLLVCDAMRPETHKSIIDETEKYLSKDFNSVETLIIINKSDLIEGDKEAYLKDYTYDFLTSAKQGDNVDLVFKELAEKIINT